MVAQLLVEPLVGEQLITLLGGAMVKLTDMGPRSADGAPQSGTLWADEIRAGLPVPHKAVAAGTQPAAAVPSWQTPRRPIPRQRAAVR